MRTTKLFDLRKRHLGRRSYAAMFGALLVTIIGMALPSAAAVQHARSSSNVKPDFAFYKGKTINYIVPFVPGSNAANTITAMQGPLEQMLGANINITYNTQASVIGNDQVASAPNDGLNIGMIGLSSALAEDFIPGVAEVNFSLQKVSWVGATNTVAEVYAACAGTPTLSSLQQLAAGQTEVIDVDNTTGISNLTAHLLLDIYNVPHKYLNGYASAQELLGCQRGDGNMEVTVPGNILNAAYTAFTPGVHPLALLGKIPSPTPLATAYAGVPQLFQFAKTTPPKTARGKRALKILKAFIAPTSPEYATFGPPGIPKARLLALQEAFQKAAEIPSVQRLFAINAIPGGWHKASSILPYLKIQLKNEKTMIQYTSS